MGFRNRLALFFMATMVGLQVLTAILAYGVVRRNLIEQASVELEGATAAFTRQLDLFSENLSDDVTVLSLDYALRRAVAEADTATTLSVLSNHGRRIGASRMILVNLDGEIAADTTRYDVIGTQFPFSNLLAEAAVDDQGTALAVLEGEIFWIVVVPVRAPVPIAFIAAGIPVDTPLLERFRSLSALRHSLALASFDSKGAYSLVSQGNGAVPLLPNLEDIPMDDNVRAIDDGSRLAMTARLDVAENSAPVIAILDYPLSEALAPYRAMLIPVLTVLALSLAIALFGSMLIARGVSKPLEALANAAQRIATGDYRSVPETSRKNEIGQLAGALKDMSASIAERETALMSAVSSLEIARDEAVAANEAKSQFLSNMSHELRTPLNAILGFSEMIQSEVVGPVGHRRYSEYARNIHESGEHLLAQLTAMLTLAEGAAGKIDLQREPISAAPLIRDITASLASTAAKSGVEIILDAKLDALPNFDGDQSKLRQSLTNIVHNAIKFSSQGSKVEVDGEVAGDTLRLRIRDHGIGIAPEDLSVVAKPFHRRRKAFDGTHQGAGVGLPLAKTLIELHGGRLEIESAPGNGTTVFVFLPLNAGDEKSAVGDAA
jgi:signal transduction histidine kinase